MHLHSRVIFVCIAFAAISLASRPAHACSDAGPPNAACNDGGAAWIGCASHDQCPANQLCFEGTCICGPCPFGDECDGGSCRCASEPPIPPGCVYDAGICDQAGWPGFLVCPPDGGIDDAAPPPDASSFDASDELPPLADAAAPDGPEDAVALDAPDDTSATQDADARDVATAAPTESSPSDSGGCSTSTGAARRSGRSALGVGLALVMARRRRRAAPRGCARAPGRSQITRQR